MASDEIPKDPYELLDLLDSGLLAEFHDEAAKRGRLDRPGVRNPAALDHLAVHLRSMAGKREKPEAIAAYAMWYVVMEQVFSPGQR